MIVFLLGVAGSEIGSQFIFYSDSVNEKYMVTKTLAMISVCVLLELVLLSGMRHIMYTVNNVDISLL